MTQQEFLDRREVYRKVFGTLDGQEVLTDILNLCGYFDHKFEDQDSIVRMDVAREILFRVGVTDHTDADRMVEITAQLLSLDPANPYRDELERE